MVDSYSTDGTRDIARQLGVKVVEHEFESWGAQRNYALEDLKLKYDFVLFIDADEMIDEVFADELYNKIAAGGYVAFNMNFDIVFLGKILKHSHESVPALRVIRKQAGRWVRRGDLSWVKLLGNCWICPSRNVRL